MIISLTRGHMPHHKVIWTEGMFLRPQHFQQQERYPENRIEARCRGLQAYGWGLSTLAVNQPMLALGKLTLSSCQGVFPDGTPFSIPDECAPAPLDVPADAVNEIVYLALPVSRPETRELGWEGGGDKDPLIRYRLKDIEVADAHAEQDHDDASIAVGELCPRLRLAKHGLNHFAAIPVARIREVKADRQIVLDDEFIPACLNIGAAQQLVNYLTTLEGRLSHQAGHIAKWLGAQGKGAAEISDFLYLMLVNRHLPLFSHFRGLTQIHPERLFCHLIQMVGEFSTITRDNHLAAALPNYQHDNLALCYAPVMAALMQALYWQPDYRAVRIEMTEHPFQVRKAAIAPLELLSSSDFILAVNADMPADKLSGLLLKTTTIASAENLANFVNNHVPGIQLAALPAKPRQIPYHKGMLYFGLDKNHREWQELQKSGALAMHFSGKYPEIELELWAIFGQ